MLFRSNERDACGVAMVATLNKKPSHEIVSKALSALRNMEHRGATGAEPDSGDGAGILIRIPDSFYREVVKFDLPIFGAYATGVFFVDKDFSDKTGIEKIAEDTDIQFFAVSRPLLAEPQLIKRWKEGNRAPVDCERCSKCRTKRGNFCVVYKNRNRRK